LACSARPCADRATERTAKSYGGNAMEAADAAAAAVGAASGQADRTACRSVRNTDATGASTMRQVIGAPDRHWLRLTATTAAQQKNRRSFSPAQMLKRHRSRCRGPDAYWSGGTGS